MEPDEISQEDIERLEEIRTLPVEVIKNAIKWWNEEAPNVVKQFIVVTAYYESMLITSEFADEALQYWNEMPDMGGME